MRDRSFLLKTICEKISEKNIVSEKELSYLEEEIKEIDMLSGWSDIYDKYHSSHLSNNPNNLMIVYLLGMSSVNPLSPRIFVEDENGLDSNYYQILFESGRISNVFPKSFVLEDEGEVVGIENILPGMFIGGEKVFVVKFSRELLKFAEKECHKELFIDKKNNLPLVPREGEHVFYHTNEFPDIDVDFSPSKLNDIVSWAGERFGENNIVPVCTYQRFGLKSSIRDISRMYDIPLDEVNDLCSGIDDEADGMSFSEAFQSFDNLLLFSKKYPEAVRVMERVQGRARNFSQHASALIISSVELNKKIPCVSREARRISSWVEGQDRSDLSTFGFVKFDRLGLQTLDDIKNCIDMIYERGLISKEEGVFRATGSLKDWSDESYLNNPEALEMASQGKTLGVFQFDSSGMRNLLIEIGIDRFSEMVAANALYRPGVLNAVIDGIRNGAAVYVKRKKKQIKYAIPKKLEECLKDTYGLMIYQEQVMKVLHIVGKIPMTDCEFVRKAISKKRVHVVNKYRNIFIENAKTTVGWSREEAEDFFDNNIVVWSGYGFNKSHSLAYALIAMRSLYLKAHYPLEFFCSFMRSIKLDKKNRIKIKQYAGNATEFGIELLPACVNNSDVNFSIDGQNIRVGLLQVKNVGDQAIKIKENAPYSSFEDFLERGCSKKDAVKSLIDAGALLCLCKNQSYMHVFYEKWKEIQGRGVGVKLYGDFLKEIGIPKEDVKKEKGVYKDFLIEESNKEGKQVKALGGSRFIFFAKKKWGDVIEDGDLSVAIMEMLNKMPSVKVLEEDIVDYTPYQKMNLAKDVYGCLMPFDNPIQKYAKNKKYCKISDYNILIKKTFPSGDVFQRQRWIDGFVERIEWKKSKSGKTKNLIAHLDDGYERSSVYFWEREIDDNVSEIVKANRIIRVAVKKSDWGFFVYDSSCGEKSISLLEMNSEWSK